MKTEAVLSKRSTPDVNLAVKVNGLFYDTINIRSFGFPNSTYTA